MKNSLKNMRKILKNMVKFLKKIEINTQIKEKNRLCIFISLDV
jgi:hypothetical protein